MRLLVVPFICCLIAACSSPEQHARQFHAFGTIVEIQLEQVSVQQAEKLFAQVDEQLQSMHNRWHAWQKGELLTIHEACQSGETLSVSEDVAYLIREGAKLEQQSQGYFNPAIGELIGLWGFLSHQSTQARRAPDAQAIAQQLSYHPSMADITVQEGQLTCNNPHLRLDFGAYAKGYGVGQIMDYLRAQGVTHALINAGGDIMITLPPNARPKKVGIASPFGDEPEAVITVSQNMSIFTSGIYARRFNDTQSHQSYHHLINPKTGYPSTTFASVTVLHPDPLVADAAATALLASDRDMSSVIIQAMGIEKYLLITQEGERISHLN
jgi:thiamine biosynthesis lipoprotein